MEILAHYGTKRHSGRYPWGSGNPLDSSMGLGFDNTAMIFVRDVLEKRNQYLRYDADKGYVIDESWFGGW